MELETNDTEPSSTPFERELSLAVAITLLLISIGSIVANALLLSAIYNNPYKCLRSPPIYYIANLAFADLLTGLFCSLYVVYDLGLYLGKDTDLSLRFHLQQSETRKEDREFKDLCHDRVRTIGRGTKTSRD